MKRLLKRLSPFAPDHAGAVSVLFELGGMIVLCDAGGCTGNVCGFDEPRWFTRRCALFSAALRDMDAILGRDDRLAAKLADAMRESGCPFAALIGTPVPAVIGTDFRALKRMAEKLTGKPVIALSAAGTHLYDEGETAAYLELFQTFARPAEPVPGRTGILGATPLDFSTANPAGLFQSALPGEVCTYNTLEEIVHAASIAKNIVTAPAGLAAARYLEKTFGTPFEVSCPVLPEQVAAQLAGLRGKKTLIVHQQFAANAVRERLPGAVCASFFRMEPEYMHPGDLALSGEESLADTIGTGSFEAVIADPVFRRLVPGFSGKWVNFTHFAVSGKLAEP